MVALGYRAFDADNHYYEPRDAFTRYLEPRFRDRAIRVVADERGRDRILVGDSPFTFLENWSFESHIAPGALREMLRGMAKGSAAGEGVSVPVEAAWRHRDDRLPVMDRQGLESCLVFPTLAVCVEHFMKNDPEQTYANLRAFNRWLDEDWGFNYRDRIYAAPLMSLLDVDAAVHELEWVLERGARIIHLRPGPVAGRSLADPLFDPFWARVNEARVAVAFHISESGYNELYSTAWGEEPNPPSHRQSAFQWTCFYGDRVMIETTAALILHNLFGRFPNIKVASVENGSLWVPYVMKAMDKMKGMGRNGPWPGGRVDGRPSEIFQQHVYVSPYHEEDIPALMDLIGPHRVLFGSDYPHPEGLAQPGEYAELIASRPADEIRLVMHDNAARLVGAV
jgi:predicted TIM-barrel fold metal-dependent hydrolase